MWRRGQDEQEKFFSFFDLIPGMDKEQQARLHLALIYRAVRANKMQNGWEENGLQNGRDRKGDRLERGVMGEPPISTLLLPPEKYSAAPTDFWSTVKFPPLPFLPPHPLSD